VEATRGIGRGEGCPAVQGEFFELSSKKIRGFIRHFIVKNYLWPETGTGVGLNRLPVRLKM